MAYVYRKGRRIYIGFKDERGKHVREATKAGTITEARRLAADRERRAERVRSGLEAPPPAPTTFAALAKRYDQEVSSQKRGHASEESRIRLHLLPELGPSLLTEIRAGDIEGLIARKAKSVKRPDGLGPKSLAHLRQTLHAMFAFALRAGLLRGVNTIDEVPRRKVPESEIRFLEPAIVPRVVAAVPGRWRDLFATAVLTGARKGELFGLRPCDVDLNRRVLTFAHSYAGPTKSGNPRCVPISDELVPFLEHALKHSRGGLVFPDPNGKMLSRHVDLPDILRRALVVAKVIDHWDLVCRRENCGHVERSDEKKSFPCPKCGFALWPVEVSPSFQFKDLRSTWGTLACEATGDLRFVQAGLGHSDPRVTEKHYAAIRAQHMVAQANKLCFGLKAPEKPVSHPALTGSPTPTPDSSSPGVEIPVNLGTLNKCARPESNGQPLGSKG